ncbi:MAG: hypothetical protein ACXAEU_20090 [Candidatus Hodarchaeales archaeon]
MTEIKVIKEKPGALEKVGVVVIVVVVNVLVEDIGLVVVGVVVGTFMFTHSVSGK